MEYAKKIRIVISVVLLICMSISLFACTGTPEESKSPEQTKSPIESEKDSGTIEETEAPSNPSETEKEPEETPGESEITDTTPESDPTGETLPESKQETNTETEPETEPETAPPVVDEKINYTVSIVDGNGKAIGDIIVKVMNGSTSAGMKVSSSSGPVTFKLKKGNYTISLEFTNPDTVYTYDESACVLTESSTSTTIVLYEQITEGVEIHAPSIKTGEYLPTIAYNIAEGSMQVTLIKGDRTYFLFEATRAGIFEIECRASENLEVGFYGGNIHFIMETNIADKNGKNALVEVKADAIGCTLVIGVDGLENEEAFLIVKRIGDPVLTIADLPWESFTEDESKVAQDMSVTPSGEEFVTIDVTDKNLTVVLNENDGYYHLGTADGPIVYIDLKEATPYIASVEEICANQRMGVYIYDDNGEFVKKLSFNELFMQYEFGRVPLTEKLAYAIKTFGEWQSWWDFSEPHHIFRDNYMLVNLDIAWLLFCGYYQ